jgi:hypothetical protein
MTGELVGPTVYPMLSIKFDRSTSVFRFEFLPLISGSYKFVASMFVCTHVDRHAYSEFEPLSPVLYLYLYLLTYSLSLSHKSIFESIDHVHSAYQSTALGDSRKPWLVSVVAGSASGNHSTVSGSLLAGGSIESVYRLSVALQDEYNNACPCSLVNGAPTATLVLNTTTAQLHNFGNASSPSNSSSNINFALSCPDDQKGIWTGNHTLDIAQGNYVLYVMLGTEAIGNPNGYAITFTDTPAPPPPAPPGTNDPSHPKRRTLVLTIGAAVVLLLIATLIIGAIVYRRRQQRRQFDTERQKLLPEFNPPDLAARPRVTVYDLLQDPAIQKIPWNELVIEDKIGIGAGGIVSSAHWKRKAVAVKEIHFGDWTFAALSPSGHAAVATSESALASFLVEIKLCSVLRHENIVEFIGVTSPNGKELCLVSELMARGSVADILAKKGKNVPLLMRIKLAIDAARGMAFLHNRNVIHRYVFLSTHTHTHSLSLSVLGSLSYITDLP